MSQLRPADAGTPTNFSDHNYRPGRWAEYTLRLASVCAGSAIIAAATFAVIDQGKLTGPHATLVMALAGGCVVGSIVAVRAARWTAAVVVLALLAGEAYGLMSTAERVIGQRAASQAMARQQNDVRVTAVERLAKAERELSEFNRTAPATAAGKSCREQCRLTLEAQRASIEREASDARVALADAPAAAEESPLANRLGVPAWVLDLISAGLLSVGSNLLGAVLIGWGARPEARPSYVVAHGGIVAAPVNVETPEIIGVAHAGTPLALTHVASDPNPDPDGGSRASMSPRAKGILRLVQDCGGQVEGGLRGLADKAGTSTGSLRRALGELEASGMVVVESGKLGTVVRMKRTA